MTGIFFRLNPEAYKNCMFFSRQWIFTASKHFLINSGFVIYQLDMLSSALI